MSDRGAELVLGLVAPVGTDLDSFVEKLSVCLEPYGYSHDDKVIRLSELSSSFQGGRGKRSTTRGSKEYVRLMRLMDAGNAARAAAGGDVLAHAAAAAIHAKRPVDKTGGREALRSYAHVLRSLKHPAEVLALRRIYGPAFFLIAVVSEPSDRASFLVARKGCTAPEVARLFERDTHEGDVGQRTRDTFELADAFVRVDDNAGLERFLRLVFGDPYDTPTADEYAMFLAFSAALRSGDLSRQVGAVVVSESGDVVAVGTNDVPAAGGGLCWPGRADDRDLIRGYDTNELERTKIVEEILRVVAPSKATSRSRAQWIARELKKLASTAVMDITEYGRAVHAEMEALLSCARSGTTTRHATLFSTTFPCHNCAKHIVAAGVRRVVYVEPYPKSRAAEFYPRSVASVLREEVVSGPDAPEISPVVFRPFHGIGPRRFFDLFSMTLSSGYPVKRKERGRTRLWTPHSAEIRVPLPPTNYVTREALAAKALLKATRTKEPHR